MKNLARLIAIARLLTVVAERTGFKHVEYLSVVFKKRTGVPPSRYRALNGKAVR